MTAATSSTAVAVYCGSSPGREKAYQHAAHSLGKEMAAAKRKLVYGGGTWGIMGIVSGAVLDAGGDAVGVIPHAMLVAGGEGEWVSAASSGDSAHPVFVTYGGNVREKMEWVVVNSMHERKIEMARRSCGFIGLPGGFGTFEEVFEVTTWTQIGIHSKPVVLANVRGYFEPVRALIQNAIKDGFIKPGNAELIRFVDGPDDHSLHETFDWGTALLEALETWEGDPTLRLPFDWTKPKNGGHEKETPCSPYEQKRTWVTRFGLWIYATWCESSVVRLLASTVTP